MLLLIIEVFIFLFERKRGEKEGEEREERGKRERKKEKEIDRVKEHPPPAAHSQNGHSSHWTRVSWDLGTQSSGL